MSLAQQDDHSPAHAGKTDQDQVLAMLSTLKTKVEKLQNNASNPGGSNNNNSNNSARNPGNRGGKTCCNCNSPDHFKRDCPLLKNPGNNGNQGKGLRELNAWRKQKLAPNAPREKIANGKATEWRNKCRMGKGLWNIGEKAHFADEDRTWKKQFAGKTTGDKPRAGLAVT